VSDNVSQAPQLPKTFCGHEGVLECSGLTELWMGIGRADEEIPSGVQPPQSKKPGSGLNFWKMITFASSRETPSPTALRPTPPSDFKFQGSVFPQAPKPSTLDPRHFAAILLSAFQHFPLPPPRQPR
jgi:hypothetical protein